MHELIFPFINLAILLTLMVVYLRAPLRQFVHNRHESLRDELHRVRELLTHSQSRYDEFHARLNAMDAEIQSIREQARQDAANSKSRMIAEAQKLNATIVSDARASAGGLYAQLKNELFADVGTRILDRAEALVRERLTGEDRTRIRNEFSAHVEKAQ